MSKLITISIITILSLTIFTNLVYAEEPPEGTNSTYIGTVTVDILFPQVGKSRKSRPYISTEPVEVMGIVSICLQIHPASGKHIGEEGYKADYYLDDILIDEQETVVEDKDGKITHILELNTAEYEPGLHTLIINLWDKHTAVGIGIKKLNVK